MQHITRHRYVHKTAAARVAEFAAHSLVLGERPPHGFLIAVPIKANVSTTSVSGVCAQCWRSRSIAEIESARIIAALSSCSNPAESWSGSRVEEAIVERIDPEAWERCRIVDAAECESLRHILDQWKA